MKRRDLLRKLAAKAKADGVRIVQIEGGSHTTVIVGERQTTIPRHREINEITARKILEHMEADS